MSEVVFPKPLAARLDEHGSARVVAELDDSFVKVAEVRGSPAWHGQANEGELFSVLERSLTTEMEDKVTERARVLAEPLRPV